MGQKAALQQEQRGHEPEGDKVARCLQPEEREVLALLELVA